MNGLTTETNVAGGYGGYGFGGGTGFGLIEGLLFGTLLRGGFGNDGCKNAEVVALEAQIATNAALTAGLYNTSNQIGETNEAITALGYTLMNQIQQTKYDVTATVNAGIQSVKDEMCASKIADLERQLAVAENGGPIVRAGAFVQANPCADATRINNIEQTIVQIGNHLTALQGAMAGK